MVLTEIVGGLLNAGLESREFGFAIGLVLQTGGEGAHLFLFDMLALSEDAFEFEEESGHFSVQTLCSTAKPWYLARDWRRSFVASTLNLEFGALDQCK